MTYISRQTAQNLAIALHEIVAAHASLSEDLGYLSPSTVKAIVEERADRYQRAVDAYEDAVVKSVREHSSNQVADATTIPRQPFPKKMGIHRNRVDGCDGECLGDDFPPPHIRIKQIINLLKHKLPGGDDARLYVGSELYAFLQNNPTVATVAVVTHDPYFEPTRGRVEVFDGYDSAWISIDLMPVGVRPEGSANTKFDNPDAPTRG